MTKVMVAILFFLYSSLFIITNTSLAFDRVAAVKHADLYWGPGEVDYNPNFTAYPADCTNFVSQCLLAGNTGFDNASGYKPEGILIRVAELGPELLDHHGATAYDISPTNLQAGDVLFLLRDFLFYEAEKEHAMIITETSPDRYNAHTGNRYHRLVSDIDLADNILFSETLSYFVLPDAPIIKYIILKQIKDGDEKIIHEYKFDDDPNYIPFETNTDVEYYRHTYNGFSPSSIDPKDNPNIAGSGKLELKIIFDTSMGTTNIDVTFGKTSPYNDHVFTTTGWSKTLHNDDTWEGEYDIPDDYGDEYSGLNKISIDAYATDGSRLDSDGNLSLYNPGPDTKHSFIINPGLDLVFVIDTTGSMYDDIAAAKAAAVDIVNEIDSQTEDYRVAVVDFRDFPIYPYGAPGDYAYNDVLNFSTDKTSIISAIQSLSLGNGMDWPESHYSALMHCFQKDNIGGWRDNVKKVAIVMTDAPPHDPEPYTGYVAQDVIDAAIALDPVIIYPIMIGFDSIALSYMETLAEGTEGEVFDAAYAGEVVEAIMEAIETTFNAPIAEANGPYAGTVGETITFDASGSYDTDGEIVLYEWDFDNDGTYDLSEITPIVGYSYYSEYIGSVRLRVTDNDGLSAIDTATVEVTQAAIPGDLDSNGCVDRDDYNIIVADVRDGEPNNPDYDLNDDGVVNIADARYLATLFTNPRGGACE
jgi:hypothetical protein